MSRDSGGICSAGDVCERGCTPERACTVLSSTCRHTDQQANSLKRVQEVAGYDFSQNESRTDARAKKEADGKAAEGSAVADTSLSMRLSTNRYQEQRANTFLSIALSWKAFLGAIFCRQSKCITRTEYGTTTGQKILSYGSSSSPLGRDSRSNSTARRALAFDAGSSISRLIENPKA